MLALRRAQRKVDIADKSREIKRNLFSLEVFLKSQTVSFYVSMETEVQTDEMVTEALAMGKRVAVPYIDRESGKLSLSELKDPAKELAPGPYTILQPHEELLRPVPLEQVQLVIVPGVAFDPRGRRLGFGKGFYDKLLAQKGGGATCVGLAFQFQVLEEIPAYGHDVPMDMIVTEKGVITARDKGAEEPSRHADETQ